MSPPVQKEQVQFSESSRRGLNIGFADILFVGMILLSIAGFTYELLH